MEFERIIEDSDHLWAVKSPGKDVDELTMLFRNWTKVITFWTSL